MRRSRLSIDGAAKAAVVVASLWFAAVAAWGMFRVPGAGHLGAGSAGITMDAEAMVRWHLVYPSWGWYEAAPPAPSTYYCHHPFGIFWLTGLFLFVFGHQDFVVYLPTILLSAAIPPLLYGIGKAYGGPVTGAVAACAYVVVPIALGFSAFNNLETLCIFGALLYFWGHSRHLATGRRRDLALSLAGLAVACAGDWVGYLIAAPILAWSLLRVLLLRDRFAPRVDRSSYLAWWAASVVIAAGTLGLWIGLFAHAGMLGDWAASGDARGGGHLSDLADLGETLHARRSWIDFSFTPLAVTLGKIAAPVALLRLALRRRDEEAYSLALLAGATVQYLAFKEGADIHIFWPHYFAPYYALALAQLAASVAPVAAWTAKRLRRVRAHAFFSPGSRAAPAMTLILGLAPSLVMVPDAVRSVPLWRRTGGRYDDRGVGIGDDGELSFVVREVVAPASPAGADVDAHPSAGWGWDTTWAFAGRAREAGDPEYPSPEIAAHPIWIGQASGMVAADQLRISLSGHLRVYGNVWVVDQREPTAPLDAYRIDEREPTPIEWMTLGGVAPVRSLEATPDPFLTWEWRIHLDQPTPAPPALPLSATPVTLDEIRIAHNAAIVSHDGKRTVELRKAIDAQIDVGVNARYTQGIRLVGVRVIDGAEPRLQCWFEASGATADEATFRIRSTVDERDPLSLVPADPIERDMSSPPRIPTQLWRPGFLYVTETILNHRIGAERYTGAWRSRDGGNAPRRTDGMARIDLLRLP